MSKEGVALSAVGRFLIDAYGGISAAAAALDALAPNRGPGRFKATPDESFVFVPDDEISVGQALAQTGTKEDSFIDSTQPCDADGTSRFVCHWTPIEGLAPDELFLVQHIDFNMNQIGSATGDAMFFLVAGKPWEANGPRPPAIAIDQGQAATVFGSPAINMTAAPGDIFSPGQCFIFGQSGQDTRQMYRMALNQGPFFYHGWGASSSFGTNEKQLDIAPQFIALKSYWTLWHEGAATSTGSRPDYWLKMYGKKVKMDIGKAITF